MRIQPTSLERYFKHFRKHIIGQHQHFKNGEEEHKLLYADWTAGGRLYWPIEETMLYKVAPWVANTHTEASLTGATMTRAYQMAREKIKVHVNANEDDVLITCGTGMTGAMAKLQRILGLYIPDRFRVFAELPMAARPVVFVSHMEHHSNHTSWLETIAETIVIPHTKDGLIDLGALEHMLGYYPDRNKIVSITACSNVTGIETPYHKIAGLAHKYGGLCFVDFACSAPYVDIDMHPNDTEYLDAIVFSPHKFLGGPGSCGVLVFNKKLYSNRVPDIPGGGTVTFTDPWGNHRYKKDIEEREDGGTPGFLQTIRAALAIRLKEEMGTENIRRREREINKSVFRRLYKVRRLHLLAEEHKERLPIFSFYIDGLNYDLITKILNDKFGIQARGGCSCAGTYGHYLMDIDRKRSESIMKESEMGRTLNRPGWVRVSFHPTMIDKEVAQVCHAIRRIATNGKEWKKEYIETDTGYRHKENDGEIPIDIGAWFRECCTVELQLHLS